MGDLQLPVTIPFSKSKIFFSLFICLAFVAGSWWLLFFAPDVFWDRRLVLAVGVLGLAYFGAAAGLTLIKLFDDRPGLIFDAEGFLDNSNSLGRVPWEDVSDLSQIRVQKNRFILVKVKDPQKYLNSQRGKPLKRFNMRLSIKTYGTPVFINASCLKISFDDLWAQIKAAYDRRPAP